MRKDVHFYRTGVTGMEKVHINLGADSYDVIIEDNAIAKAGGYIAGLTHPKKVMIITEDGVDELYGNSLKSSLEKEGVETQVVVVPATDKSKNLNVLNSVYGALAGFHITGNDTLVALGGRVVGDITGFAAATWHRGTPYVQMPTSVLAQIGSSIGGKISIDTAAGNNLVGMFYQPKAVYIDPTMARTLPRRYFHNGLGEAVKLGAAADKELFEVFEKASSDQDLMRMLPEILKRCVAIKAHYVELDPKDRGERRILDLGHTIGHAIERYYRYDDNEITHGEATALGMYLITKRSELLGLTKRGTAERLCYVLKSIGLPTEPGVTSDKLSAYIRLDKRIKGDQIEIALLKEIGEGYIYSVPMKEVGNYIKF